MFSRLFRALGFEWRFYFTFPIPYHPFIAWALPWVPVALLGWMLAEVAQGRRPAIGWWDFAMAGLLLVIPLSVPIFNWIAFAFRGPLLQGFCFLASMLLLGAEVAAGREPLWLASLPIAYFSLFLVQRIAGPRFIARLQAENAAFAPLNAGDRLVIFRGPGSVASQKLRAQALFVQFGLAMLAIRPRWRRRGTILFRPNDAAETVLRSRLREGEWKADSNGLRFEQVPIPRFADRVRLTIREGKHWLVSGRLSTVTIDDGDGRRRLAGGQVAAVGNWPLLVLAYDFAIFSGGGRNAAWQGGFAPGRPVVDLGQNRAYQLTDKVLVPQTPSAHAGAAAMTAIIDAMMPDVMRRRDRRIEADKRQRRKAEAEVRRWLEHEGHSPLSWRWRLLRDRPDFVAGHGQRLCLKLAEAKEQRHRGNAEGAAALLAALPPDEFVALEKALIPLIGSRILALQWQLTPDLDLSKLPKNCPRWGPIAGFGLMGKVPELWARLGELGPDGKRVVEAFVKEVGERPPLVDARRRFAERAAAGEG